jgi:hypothetical protein
MATATHFGINSFANLPDVVLTSPSSGHVLSFDGASWVNGTPSFGATTLTGDLTMSTHNVITDGTTGTKIGTATTQKLGFWGTTPVVQQANASAAGVAGIRTDTLAHAVADTVVVLTAFYNVFANTGIAAATA